MLVTFTPARNPRAMGAAVNPRVLAFRPATDPVVYPKFLLERLWRGTAAMPAATPLNLGLLSDDDAAELGRMLENLAFWNQAGQ